MEVPSFDEMMQPTLDALRELGGKAAVNDLTQAILARLALPAEVMAVPHAANPSMTEVEYRLHWSRTYLKAAGLIDNPTRGRWELTPEGRAAGQIDPAALVRAYKKQQRAGKVGEQPGLLPQDEPGSGETPFPAQGGASAGAAAQTSLTPSFPTYKLARHFVRILDGASSWLYHGMASTILEARGNPQEQADWTQPDEWIPQLLSGDERKLALRIWHESGGTLNPRHTRGCWYLSLRHELLVRNGDGILCMGERGRQFLAEPAGTVTQEIDREEGVLLVLQLVAERGPGKRGDFLPDYAGYCRSQTTCQADAAIKATLYDRLRNLIERGYILSRGQTYEITNEGLAYLGAGGRPTRAAVAPPSKQAELFRLASDLKQESRDRLAEHLGRMDPFKFEGLIKLLLEEMGYDDVQTTSPTNDKGVDVVANIQLGISSVREVIQVKRHKGNVNRVVLDQLRGSLHRFRAVRGTVITTGHFSKGTQEAAFEHGAAPITLIDGDKLLHLLIEYQIGVSKKTVDYFEFDPARLTEFEIDSGEG